MALPEGADEVFLLMFNGASGRPSSQSLSPRNFVRAGGEEAEEKMEVAVVVQEEEEKEKPALQIGLA